jgi:hypothetical protein
MTQNQSCIDCVWGPAYTEQHAGRCGQRIDTTIFDGIRNDCMYWDYTPGADVEYEDDGTVSLK